MLLTVLTAMAQTPTPTGPWCLPGWPVCTFALYDDEVFIEASSVHRPWRRDGDVIIFDPGSPAEQRWRLHVVEDNLIEATSLESGVLFWFTRSPTLAPDYLSDIHTARWPLRAAVAAGPAQWKLRASDRWSSGHLDAAQELVVVDVTGDAVRAVGTWGALRAAVWLPMDALLPHLTEPVAISADLTVQPGAPVEVLGRREGKLLARITEADGSLEALVHPDAVGVIYPPRPARTEPARIARAAHPDTRPLRLPADALLLRGEEVVGVTLEATTLTARAQQSAPEVFAWLPTPWGEQTVVVQCPALTLSEEEWICDP